MDEAIGLVCAGLLEKLAHYEYTSDLASNLIFSQICNDSIAHFIGCLVPSFSISSRKSAKKINSNNLQFDASSSASTFDLNALLATSLAHTPKRDHGKIIVKVKAGFYKIINGQIGLPENVHQNSEQQSMPLIDLLLACSNINHPHEALAVALLVDAAYSCMLESVLQSLAKTNPSLPLSLECIQECYLPDYACIISLARPKTRFPVQQKPESYNHSYNEVVDKLAKEETKLAKIIEIIDLVFCDNLTEAEHPVLDAELQRELQLERNIVYPDFDSFKYFVCDLALRLTQASTKKSPYLGWLLFQSTENKQFHVFRCLEKFSAAIAFLDQDCTNAPPIGQYPNQGNQNKDTSIAISGSLGSIDTNQILNISLFVLESINGNNNETEEVWELPKHMLRTMLSFMYSLIIKHFTRYSGHVLELIEVRRAQLEAKLEIDRPQLSKLQRDLEELTLAYENIISLERFLLKKNSSWKDIKAKMPCNGWLSQEGNKSIVELQQSVRNLDINAIKNINSTVYLIAYGNVQLNNTVPIARSSFILLDQLLIICRDDNDKPGLTASANDAEINKLLSVSIIGQVNFIDTKFKIDEYAPYAINITTEQPTTHKGYTMGRNMTDPANANRSIKLLFPSVTACHQFMSTLILIQSKVAFNLKIQNHLKNQTNLVHRLLIDFRISPETYPFVKKDGPDSIVYLNDSSANIRECTDDQFGKILIKSATLDKFIEKMTTVHIIEEMSTSFIDLESSSHIMLQQEFILNYSYFCTSMIIFDRLMVRFNIPINDYSPVDTASINSSTPTSDSTYTLRPHMESDNLYVIEKKRLLEKYFVIPIQLGVLSLIRMWIEHFPDDLFKDIESVAVLPMIVEFVYGLEREERCHSQKRPLEVNKTIKALIVVLERQMANNFNQEIRVTREIRMSKMINAPINLDNTTPPAVTIDIITADPLVLATEMHALDRMYFCKIGFTEFQNQNWRKSPGKASNLLAWIHFFNRISLLTVTWVCSTPILAERALVLSKLIDVIVALKEKHFNFNASMALLAGLNNSSVYRLTETWDKVSDKRKRAFEKINAMFSSQSNFAALRQHHQSPIIEKIIETSKLAADSPQRKPIIPFLGMYLTDLTFIDDGNDNFIAPAVDANEPNKEHQMPKQINFFKVRLISRVISELLSFQKGHMPHIVGVANINTTPVISTISHRLSQNEKQLDMTGCYIKEMILYDDMWDDSFAYKQSCQIEKRIGSSESNRLSADVSEFNIHPDKKLLRRGNDINLKRIAECRLMNKLKDHKTELNSLKEANSELFILKKIQDEAIESIFKLRDRHKLNEQRNSHLAKYPGLVSLKSLNAVLPSSSASPKSKLPIGKNWVPLSQITRENGVNKACTTTNITTTAPAATITISSGTLIRVRPQLPTIVDNHTSNVRHSIIIKNNSKRIDRPSSTNPITSPTPSQFKAVTSNFTNSNNNTLCSLTTPKLINVSPRIDCSISKPLPPTMKPAFIKNAGFLVKENELNSANICSKSIEPAATFIFDNMDTVGYNEQTPIDYGEDIYNQAQHYFTTSNFS